MNLALPGVWEHQLAQYRLGPAQLGRTLGVMAESLGAARAEATWRNIASVWNNLKDPVRQNPEFEIWAQLELEQRMTMWAEWKTAYGHLNRTSPLTYVKTLEQVYRLLKLQPLSASGGPQPTRPQALMRWLLAAPRNGVRRPRKRFLSFDSVKTGNQTWGEVTAIGWESFKLGATP